VGPFEAITFHLEPFTYAGDADRAAIDAGRLSPWCLAAEKGVQYAVHFTYGVHSGGDEDARLRCGYGHAPTTFESLEEEAYRRTAHAWQGRVESNRVSFCLDASRGP
jgi:hypothetical protein